MDVAPGFTSVPAVSGGSSFVAGLPAGTAITSHFSNTRCMESISSERTRRALM